MGKIIILSFSDNENTLYSSIISVLASVVEEYDAKITAAKERIKSLEAKKQEILAPKAPRKPRKTKKQKIQEIVKLAMKNGMSVEEIAGQLHVEVEN